MSGSGSGSGSGSPIGNTGTRHNVLHLVPRLWSRWGIKQQLVNYHRHLLLLLLLTVCTAARLMTAVRNGRQDIT